MTADLSFFAGRIYKLTSSLSLTVILLTCPLRLSATYSQIKAACYISKCDVIYQQLHGWSHIVIQTLRWFDRSLSTIFLMGRFTTHLFPFNILLVFFYFSKSCGLRPYISPVISEEVKIFRLLHS